MSVSARCSSTCGKRTTLPSVKASLPVWSGGTSTSTYPDIDELLGHLCLSVSRIDQNGLKKSAMTQVMLSLVGQSRAAVEEALAHLEATAAIQGLRWVTWAGTGRWRLDAILIVPPGSQPPTRQSEQPLQLSELGLS